MLIRYRATYIPLGYEQVICRNITRQSRLSESIADGVASRTIPIHDLDFTYTPRSNCISLNLYLPFLCCSDVSLEDGWRDTQLRQALCILQNCVSLHGLPRRHCVRHTCSAAAVSPTPPPPPPQPQPHRTWGEEYAAAVAEDEDGADGDGGRMVVSKRWQYSDPLQVCIAQNCGGQQGAPLYQCVFKECIMKGINRAGPMVLAPASPPSSPVL
jgi:hypothetical protein